MILINIQNHKQLIKDILTNEGLPVVQALITSEIMSYADQRGIDSHGIILLKTYIDRMRKGIINNKPNIEYERIGRNILKVNGDCGIGHYLGKLAMEKSINIAKENSIGIVFVKNATHYGASCFYTELAAKHGMFGFTTTNTMPLMAPTGGKERVLGNNPISMSMPRENKEPIILDIATSVVAAGKLILANQKNESIPKGWAVDKEGNHTNNPFEGYEGGGSLLPVAQHKGYGLSFFIDILAGVLGGGKFGKDVSHSDIGFVMVALNIEELTEDKYSEGNMEYFVDMIKGAERVDGINEIYLPGEIEYLRKEERKNSGIPINSNLYKEIENLVLSSKLSMDDYF